jgi:hypothetical protein
MELYLHSPYMPSWNVRELLFYLLADRWHVSKFWRNVTLKFKNFMVFHVHKHHNVRYCGGGGWVGCTREAKRRLIASHRNKT